MHQKLTLSILAVLAACAAVSACADSSKPPETPEAATATAEAEPPPANTSEPAPEPSATAMGGVVNAPKADKSMMLDSYEMTPSDCDALGKKYGELARGDMAAQLSPKLSEKQRSATMEKIDKAVAPKEEAWTKGCMTSLVNKAADHDAIKCALNAKTVKDFDVCINGQGGTPQPAPAGKPKKK